MSKSKEQLQQEIERLSGRVSELEAGEEKRKEVEQALRESEAKFRNLVENSPATVVQSMVSADGAFSFPYIGETVQQMAGVSAEAIMRDSTALFELVHPDDAEMCQEEILKSIQNIEPFQCTFRFLKDEETRWVDVRTIPEALPDGTLRWNGYFNDVTDREHAKEALVEQTEETTTLLQAARAVLEEKDFTTSARSIFDACRALTGATAGYVALLSDDGQENEVMFLEAGGMPCTVDPELPMPIRGLRAASYKTGRAVHENDFKGSDWWDLMPEGHVHLSNVIFAPLIIEGKTLGIMGLANKPSDFTDRDIHMAEAFGGLAAIALRNARATEALLISARKWQNTFDAMSDLTCVLSPEHEFLEVNQAVCDTLGLKREELRGKKCYEIVHGTTEPIPECPCRKLKLSNNGQTQSSTYSDDGRHYELLAWPILDERDDLMSIVHVVRDITERIELEEQLLQSQKMDAIGRLAGGVAHDFNNILTGINGYAELVIDDLDPGDPIRSDLHEIKSAGERAAGLTKQLLAFSRKQTISPKVVRPSEILERSQQMLQRIIGEDIDLEFIPAGNLGRINADPAQLDQILVNLSVNAREAMPDGGKLTIEIQNVSLSEKYCESRIEAEPGDYIMLAVSDSGHGMDEKTKSRIFEPFFSTKEKDKGTGLGLATVYGIVKQNGGFISVDSELEKGTIFKVYFPRVVETAEAFTEAMSSEIHVGTETVLLVEDEELVRNLARRILETRGYRVIEKDNGSTAFLYCNQNDNLIDLLLTDVVMPNMNGKDLFDKLQDKRPELKALFMSGYTEDVIAHHGVLDDGISFIQKPFTIASLASAVRRVLDQEN